MVLWPVEGKTAKTQVEIIYQDDDIIVVNKPSGISVTKDRIGAAKLANILGKQLGKQLRGELRLVHHTSDSNRAYLKHWIMIVGPKSKADGEMRRGKH